MLLMIDNYDSFTYNLVHYLNELGAETLVRRNDAMSPADALALKPEAVLLSPGPCDPDQAGICLPLLAGPPDVQLTDMFGATAQAEDVAGDDTGDGGCAADDEDDS